jgi:hypothetical protein
MASRNHYRDAFSLGIRAGNVMVPASLVDVTVQIQEIAVAI